MQLTSTWKMEMGNYQLSTSKFIKVSFLKRTNQIKQRQKQKQTENLKDR